MEAKKLNFDRNQNAQKIKVQTKNDKPPKPDERTTYKVKMKIDDYYMPLNTSRGRILNEIMNLELKDVDLDVLKPLRIRNGERDQSNYYRYHHAIGHDTTIVFN